MLAFIEQEPRVLRPLNYAGAAPGRGARMFDAPGGRKVFVAQVLGQVFMKRPFDDPFSAVDAALKPATLGGTAAAVIVDVHAEATSEKMAHRATGATGARASWSAPTPTCRPPTRGSCAKGAAYQSDAGMCGDYDSVIGMDKLEPMTRFVTGMAKGPLRAGRGRGDALRRLRRDRRRHRAGAARRRRCGSAAASRLARRRERSAPRGPHAEPCVRRR